MNTGWGLDFRRTVRQVALGTAGVAAVTAAFYPLHPDLAIAGCLYLLLVVLQSAFASFAASAIVSVIAILCLDFFFVPPLLSLEIGQPVYALGLVTFLVTALVITRLASKAREEARNAESRRKDLARLYEVASRLVSVGPDVAVQRGYLGVFREVLGLRAMCLYDGAAAALSCDGESAHDLAAETKAAYLSGRDHSYEATRIAVRCLRISGKPIGAVGFDGLNDADSTAGPLSVLAAAMIQRARAFETASEAAAAAQVEVLRSAILDAFAHQFKTPLAAILTAAGGIRETGTLASEQHEMVETIEAQAAGLGRLTTRLLRMARLDRDEIKPRMQITPVSDLVARIAQPFRSQDRNHILDLRCGDRSAQVLSDPDMLGLAIVQLIENAFRYSEPASTVTVAVDSDADCAVIRVTNEGSRIPPEEQPRIFDRFYRGSGGNQAPGTGLGLYIARKIVLAHGGTLELDRDHVYGQDTTFYLKLPIAKEKTKHAPKSTESLGCR